MNHSQELTAQISQLIQQHVGMSGQPHQQPLAQQLIASIASTIEQQMSTTVSQQPATPTTVLRQPPPQPTTVLQPPPPPPMTPQTPVRDLYRRFDKNVSASLRRSDSASSNFSRSSSLTSSTSNLSSASTYVGRNVVRRLIENDDGGFDECYQLGPRRRSTSKTPPEMKVAVKIVTKPVLGVVDKNFLAVKMSNLFKRKFKVGGKKNRKIKKKNPEIVMKLFKVLIVPVLQVLFTREYTQAKSQEPSLTPFQFRQRLFNAALKVVRKRRANHIQNWRIYNCPKPLIYSDETVRPTRLPDDLFDNADNDKYDSDDDGTRDGGDGNDSASTLDYEESQQIPLSQPPPIDFSEDDFSGDDDGDVSATTVSANVVASSLPPPPVTMFRVTTKCCECGSDVDFNSGFPQDKDNDWGDKKVRCEECWDKHVDNNLINEIQEPQVRKKKERQIQKQRQKRKPDKENSERSKKSKISNKKRKKRRITACKWCNSTTHKTRRSKECPFNKRNPQTTARPAQPPTPQQQQPPPQLRDPKPPAPPAPPQQQQLRDPKPPAPPQQQQLRDPKPPPPQQQQLRDPKPPPPQQQQLRDPKPPPPQQQKLRDPKPPPPQQHDRAAPHAGPVTPPIPIRCRFKIGDNCLAQFNGGWYLAQVFDFDDHAGTYSVYFPGDSKTKTRVRPQSLRDPPATSPSRHEFQNKEFYFDGDDDLPSGRWKVRRIIHNKNTFSCVRLTGGGHVNIDEFDIGYVMRQVKVEEEGFREHGPMWIPPGL